MKPQTISEVKRFRKLVANHVFDNQSEYHKTLGLSAKIGPIFNRADSYDLHITSPNGMKTTHMMTMESMQHPAGIHNAYIGVIQMKIPLLKEHELSTTQLANDGIQLEHYVGPSKRNPSLLQPQPLSPNESQLQSASAKFGREIEALGLSQVHGSDKPIEWGSFNIQQDHLLLNPMTKP